MLESFKAVGNQLPSIVHLHLQFPESSSKMKFIGVFASLLVLTAAMPTGDKRSRADKNLLVGDIRFPAGFDPKSGLVDERYRWPNRQLVYEIDSAFTASEQDIIRGAFNEISSKTCVSFRQRTNENDYVAIRRGAVNSGCWSYVGRIGGRQELNLQPPEFPGAAHCIWVGTAAHELTHAIGFEHEQSRTDRDDYVEMNWSNIPTEYHYAFDKYGPELVSGFGAPYDYRSIMHYDAYAFAINPSIPTIIPKQAGAVLGGDQLTSYDILKINNMYKC